MADEVNRPKTFLDLPQTVLPYDRFKRLNSQLYPVSPDDQLRIDVRVSMLTSCDPEFADAANFKCFPGEKISLDDEMTISSEVSYIKLLPPAQTLAEDEMTISSEVSYINLKPPYSYDLDDEMTISSEVSYINLNPIYFYDLDDEMNISSQVSYIKLEDT